MTIDSLFGELVVTTTAGAASSRPYFSANLHNAPLLVNAGGAITLTATYNESMANQSYVTVAGGQQADLVIRSSTLFGDGSDGALTISTDTIEAPIDSAASGTSGSTTLSATNASFTPGLMILIHQSQGVGAGTWMRNQIVSYTPGTIVLTTALNANYTSGAQVRVLKQYTNVTINSGKTYSAEAWNGTVGGILAFIASGTVSIAGSINATGKGFRGGGLHRQGEGTAGDNSGTATTANGNGGGAANANGQNAGGGGGGNGSSGMHGNNSGVGIYGDGGNSDGTSDLITIVMGGGGGGGDGSGSPGVGNTGGGINAVFGHTIGVTGSIISSGLDGAFGGVGNQGGGGAGGSVLFRGVDVTLGSSLVTAAGGLGGPDGTLYGYGGVGRIHVDYYASSTGNTSPTASKQQLACSSLPIPTINSIVRYVANQAADTLTFHGLSASADLCDTTITTYVWRSDVEGVLSTSPSFTRTASSLHVGTYPIYFKAKDSNNNWSQEISRTITIQSSGASQSRLYLPTLLRDFSSPGTFESEPNNTAGQADGPLQSGVDYHGYQNDADDYFKFSTTQAGLVTVELSNLSAQGTQLQLLNQSLGLVGYAGGAPYSISHIYPAGSYYVRIFSASGLNSATPYTLRVTYP